MAHKQIHRAKPVSSPNFTTTTSFNPVSSFTGDIFGSMMNDIAKSFGAGSVKDMWIRAALVVLGGLLLLTGVVIMAAPSVMGFAKSDAGQATIEAVAPEAGITSSALGSGRQQSRAMQRSRARTQASRAESEGVRAAASKSRADTQAARERRLGGSP